MWNTGIWPECFAFARTQLSYVKHLNILFAFHLISCSFLQYQEFDFLPMIIWWTSPIMQLYVIIIKLISFGFLEFTLESGCLVQNGLKIF